MQSLPVLHVRAESYYQIGQAIGSTFKGWISEFMQTAGDVSMLRRFYNSPSGKQIYDRYLETSRQYYPNTVSEIQGMADGAGQSFEDIFLIQIVSEVYFCHQHEVIGHTKPTGTGTIVKGCTDILVHSDTVRLIGHNDDWTDTVSMRTYIVHVTLYDQISDENDVQSQGVNIKEEFVSYVYPGSLPGFCFGMNKNIAITLNTLMPKRAVRGGVPLQILLRQLLACNTIDTCVEVMKGRPVGCAYGMNINIACINNSDMCSMEVYPTETGTEVAVKRLPPSTSGKLHDTSGVRKPILHHQNHYKYIQNVEEMDGHTIGSRRRESRVGEFESPETECDIRTILGDTEDDLEPVYSTPNEGHIEANLMTSATAIFNLKERRLDVYRDNPRLSAAPCITIPFLT